MAFKTSQPGLRFAEEGVTPDEMDAYAVYNVNAPTTPALQPLAVASGGTAGTSEVVPIIINNKIPDYPRNVQFALAGSHGAMTGTLELNGKDQFGNDITESFTFDAASNGGTVVGTKVFGQFTDGTVSYGTALGAGTPSISYSAGTDCLFGLPVKLGATTDVIHYGMNTGTGAISVGQGSSIGTLVDTDVHAFRPFAAFGGTHYFNVWVKSSFVAERQKVAAQSQP